MGGMTSRKQEEITVIFDTVLQQIARKIARVELRVVKPPPEAEDVVSVYLTTKGEVKAQLFLQLDRNLMRELTTAMSRTEALSEENAVDYIKEFFNIFCGHLAAALRRVTKKRARFGIAHFLVGTHRVDMQGGNLIQRCYASAHGVLRLRASWR